MRDLPSELALRGVDILLDSYARIDEGTGVVLGMHRACAETAVWVAAALSLRGVPVETYCFDHRDDALFQEALEERLERIRGPRVRRVAVIICELSTMTFRRALTRAQAADPEGISIVRLINCSPDLFELAFQVTAEEQRRINATVINKLHAARRLRITSALGTDLEITLDSSRYRWVSNFGVPWPGELVMLPAGEVNTFPASIRGRLVADGAFNLNFAVDADARLAGRPVRVDIEGGAMVSYHCDDPGVRGVLDGVFAEEAARNVGELGFGTNLGIKRFIAMNSHINERHPGVHIGFGEHGQPGRVPFQALRHLDLIFEGAEITIDDREVIDSKSFIPTDLPHPAGVHCEDTDAAV